MRSTSGEHYIALDHVRAFAAFLVVVWHFTHGANGFPIPFSYTPALFAVSVFDEGHTGVALFMTLSGYLFAKLLDGKRVHFPSFYWNRVLRLAPLLIVVLVAAGTIETSSGRTTWSAYGNRLVTGLWRPDYLPNGAWSITIEFQYYFLLPLFLWLQRKAAWLPILLVAGGLVGRIVVMTLTGEAQSVSYWTLLGRVDQFAFGSIAYSYRHVLERRHLVAACTAATFLMIYQWFDAAGGFYALGGQYPSTNTFWIVLPLIEGFSYALLIAWYDTSFSFKNAGLSGLVAQAGAYSYSIYLLHPFFVFWIPRLVSRDLIWLSTFLRAWAMSAVFYVGMAIIGYVSFRWIEAPFLRFRRKYVLPQESRT